MVKKEKILYLKYKGVLFDEWVEDEYGIWVTICPECVDEYIDDFFDELESHGSGCCSVKECLNEDNDEAEMKYLNIKEDEAFIITENSRPIAPMVFPVRGSEREAMVKN